MTQPYWVSADGRLVIYHGDCREILPVVGNVDVTVTDPPYGINLVTKTSDYRDSPAYDHGRSLQASVLYQDDPAAIRALIREVMPIVLGLSDRVVVFPGPAMLWAYPEPRAIGCVFSAAGAGRSPWGFQCMHPVLYYGRDPYLVDGRGGRPNSLNNDQPNREKFDHPCPKPFAWMRWAIGRSSRPGELILDPFMGSGTTLAAAHALNRRAIGIEIEERYCEIAARRLEDPPLLAAVRASQGDLFAEVS